MARPPASTDILRGVPNAALAGRPAPAAAAFQHAPPNGHHRGANGSGAGLSQEEVIELAHLRAENGQLHQLCVELEQALQEASQGGAMADLEARIKEYETLLDGKSQTIAELHQQLQDVRSLAEDLETQLNQAAQPGGGDKSAAPRSQGPAPCEEELLALSEELERERRQLQEDEQSLMVQMREMEVSMAKERAEMARQRNDLQRLQAEIHHEIERLERSGGLQSKIEALKIRLQDTTARRGAAPAQLNPSGQPQPSPSQPTPLPQKRRAGFMGRLFGK